MAEFKNDVLINVKLDSSDYQKNIDLINDKLNETEQEVEKLNQQLSNQDLGQAERQQLTHELEQQQAMLSALNNSLEEQTNSLNESNQATTNYANTVDGLSQHLTDLQNDLKGLEIGSDAFNDKLKEIDATENKLATANPTKKKAEESAKAFGALNQSVGLLNLAFAGNEKASAAIQKGMQLVTAATVAANIAKERNAIITTIQTVKTKAETIAQTVYAAAVGTTTGALRAMRIALATTGIGALVAGLGLLIAHLSKTKKETNELTEEQKKLADATKTLREEETKELVQATKVFNQLRESNAGSVERKKLIDQINSTYGTTLKNLSDESEFLRQVAEAQAQVIAGIQAKIAARIVEAQLENEIRALLQAQAALSEDDLKIANLRIELNRTTNEQDRIRIQNQLKELESTKLINQQQETLNKNYDDYGGLRSGIDKQITNSNKQQIDQYVLLQSRVDNITKRLIGFQEAATTTATTTTQAVRTTTEDILKIQQDYLFKVKQAEINLLEQGSLREKEQLRLNREIQQIASEQQLNDLIKKYGDQSEVVAQFRILQKLEEDKFQQDLLAIDKKYSATKKDDNKKSLEERLKAIQDAAEIEARIVRESQINTGETQKERLAQEKEFQRELLEIRRKALQDQLRLAIEEAVALSGAIGQIPVEQQKVIDGLKQSLIELGIQIDELGEKTGDLPDDFGEAFQALSDEALKVIDAFGNAVNTIFENQLKNIDKLANEEKKAVQESTLTERQKAEQIAKIEEDAAKKRYKAEVDAFNFQKGIQIAQTIAAGAQALVALLTVPDFTFGVLSAIRTAIIIGTTAAQVGVIAAQQPPPPPSFEVGGYTGDGSPFETSTSLGKKNYIYHKGEYVVPNKILKSKQGAALVNQLESMRLNKVGSLGLVGFADGGFTSSTFANNVSAQLQTEQLAAAVTTGLQNVQIVTRVTDINRVNKNIIQTKAKSTLR